MSDDQLAEGPDSTSAQISDDSLQAARQRSAQIEAELAANPAKFRVLTGDRPTGPLHLGHYLGTLRNRVRLQNLGVETFIVVADYQVITDRDEVGSVADRVRELVINYLAVGLDPRRCTIFTHSAVPALNQLLLPFLSLVSDSELRRNPTVKAEHDATGGRPMSGLLLTYPVHQAADLLFSKANLAPVGKDQLPHLELSRVIARRFNERYAQGQELFPAPEALLSEQPLVLGVDGTKMSKTKGNGIELGMTEAQTAKLLRGAVTDSERLITYDPQNRPEVASLLQIAASLTGRDPADIAAEIGTGGGGGLKQLVTEAVNTELRPIRERRRALLEDPGYLAQVLAEGNARANAIADATLTEVREVMGMVYR